MCTKYLIRTFCFSLIIRIFGSSTPLQTVGYISREWGKGSALGTLQLKRYIVGGNEVRYRRIIQRMPRLASGICWFQSTSLSLEYHRENGFICVPKALKYITYHLIYA